MKIIKNFIFVIVLAILFSFSSCQKAGVNNTGSEYMPDMYHSIAYEANYGTYYDRNEFVDKKDYRFYGKPRKPVKGTISRDNGVSDSRPFYYGDTEDERQRAIAEITKSPFPATKENIAAGKHLFGIYCAICHGEKGDGEGYLVREDGGAYPAMPANFLSDDLKNSSDGRYYYTIMKGRNMMESFGDKLDYKERWQVIGYIRSLQK